ncbi:MAG TPA: hypothetical protein G4N92_03875 [Anaerolineae bacterium]|nr:hypothetical protein [Anaerolineae bacterium]
MAVLSSLMLVPFWHAYMSFLTPLFTAENLLTDSTSLANSLSERIRRLVYCPFFPAAVGAYGGIMLGINLPNAQQAVTSAILNTAVVTTLIAIWMLFKGKRHYHLVDLLPRPTATFILGILLSGYYIYFSLNLRIEALPSISQQVTIWLMYVVLIALIMFSVRKDKLAAQKHQQPIANVELSPLSRLRFKHWLFFAAGFIFSAAAANLLPDIMRLLFTAIAFYGGMAFGVMTLIVTIFGLKNK